NRNAEHRRPPGAWAARPKADPARTHPPTADNHKPEPPNSAPKPRTGPPHPDGSGHRHRTTPDLPAGRPAWKASPAHANNNRPPPHSATSSETAANGTRSRTPVPPTDLRTPRTNRRRPPSRQPQARNAIQADPSRP